MRLARYTMNLRKRLPALESKDYRMWFVGQSVSVIGTWLQNTGQAWLVLKLTNSPFQLGLVTSIQYLPSLFLPLFIGPLVDLLPKRTILIWTQSLLGVMAAILSVICFIGNVQYWQILIIAAITGLVSVVDFPARQSFISEQVNDRSAVVNAVALNNLSFNLARIIGPAVGGIMIALVGIPWTFALNAVSFSAVVTSLFFMKAGRVPVAVRSGNFRGEIKKGYQYIARNKVIVTLLAIAGTLGLFIFNFNILIPSYVKLTLGLGAGEYGVLMAALGAGALIASTLMAFAGTKLEPTPKLLLGSGLILCIAMILVGLQKNLAVATFFLLFCGFGMTSFGAMSNTAIQMQSSPEMRGRVMSAYNLVWIGTTPIGSLYIGGVSDSLGPAAGFWISGSICLVFLLFMLFFVVPKTFFGLKTFVKHDRL